MLYLEIFAILALTFTLGVGCGIALAINAYRRGYLA